MGFAGRQVGALLWHGTRNAVGYLHSNKMTHLDIKPDNIMLAREADGSLRPVLIDFGLSKHYDDTGRPTSTINTLARHTVHVHHLHDGICRIVRQSTDIVLGFAGRQVGAPPSVKSAKGGDNNKKILLYAGAGVLGVAFIAGVIALLVNVFVGLSAPAWPHRCACRRCC